ncbi:MAG: UrcA family protein [Hyphomonadaceae bacterium]|nr:UrcA family protein [Hyphomonadaceae bacterium]
MKCFACWRPMRVLAIFAAAFACLMLTSVAEAKSQTAPKQSVRAMQGVAEGDPAAVAGTYRRVVRAARRVCGAAGATLQERAYARACVAEAVDRAVAEQPHETLRVYRAALDTQERYAVGAWSRRLAVAEAALGRTAERRALYEAPARVMLTGGGPALVVRLDPLPTEDPAMREAMYRRLAVAVARVCGASSFGRVTLHDRYVQGSCVTATMNRALAEPKLAALAMK